MDEIGPIEKSGYNAFHKYAYLREQDIINAVRPLLVKHGVAIIPRVLSEQISQQTTSRGNTETLCRIQMEYTFVDIESGQQIPVVTIGHGTDAGDKAAYKAETGALKYCLRQVFMISEGGDDPEADESADQRRAQEDQPSITIGASNVEGVGRGGRNANPNAIQIARLRDLARERGMSLAGMATLIATVHGDEVDISDPASAGINLQTYLVGGPAGRVSALIRALEERSTETEEGLPEVAGGFFDS